MHHGADTARTWHLTGKSWQRVSRDVGLGTVTFNMLLELHGEINVAKVDGTKSKLLNKRFGIKSYPTLIYFHHGKLYRYKGPRKVELLAKFAQDILHEGVFPENVVEEDVPGEISPSDVSLDGLSGFIESLSLPELLLIAILVSGSGAGLLVYLTSGGSTKKTDKKKQ
mmetsp:Transcript_9872/g.18584  ORF Transcript_9872/g.18584 Transcript_9872/m.18584 type:complete len:168 (+) Transcript_9872:368-871(+)